ncbi:GH36-type glycosyl hydrolase domain-containing protein [Bdellovibrio sp. HCB274]|uniref:GH36-type glycosyl hydrolase domain-containing protein n=1 Tax=Bdellovibrio sp. HCB274 TaxID=3394361 RepID=UPI0039B54888
MAKKFNITQQDILEIPIKAEIFSTERLEEYAVYLGENLKTGKTTPSRKTLIKRSSENGKKLLIAYRLLATVGRKKESVSPAAEWLIDNFHIVEEQLREIEEDLPPSYYLELPKATEGELAGYPRIYALALALIAHSDSRLSVDLIRRFVLGFQTRSYLNMGELWAVAITLRIALVENLRRVALRIAWDFNQSAIADDLVEQLLENVRRPKKFQKYLKQIVSHCQGSVETELTFIAQVAKRLRDAEADVWPVIEAMNAELAKVNLNIEQIVAREHQHQATSQVTIANIISSMRLINNIDWKVFFESVSQIDRLLEEDPSGDYARMEFITRDDYRHNIERIGKRTKTPERDIATRAIERSQQDHCHVGYYLYGKGLRSLEQDFKYRPRLRESWLRLTLRHPTLVYFSSIAVLICLTMIGPIDYAMTNTKYWYGMVAAVFAMFIPFSDLAVTLFNYVLTRVINPRRLGKMDFRKGVPAEYRTLVIVPCLLTDEETIENLVERIEVHYLGNLDSQVYFALATDFVDADSEHRPDDEKLVSLTQRGINRLNEKHGADRFFFLHRKRLWNPHEKKWMGWERKRGKIEELNRILLGKGETSYTIMTIPEEIVRTFKYVITLDADTQLGLEGARHLIGVAAHPLNRAKFSELRRRVTDGYGIIQPRVSISLESSSRSVFASVFSGHTGIDPYTTAVSDVYQDLFNEGSFTGKGLYDIEAFDRSLEGRVPDNTILSHDLFEGLYARTALATDIEVMDDYPSSYKSYSARAHRWVRGDWQVGPWTLPFVQNHEGKMVVNDLPLISRWKIWDNLRRSLVAPCLMFLYVASWLILPGDAWFWTGVATVTIAIPILLQLVNALMVSPRGGSWTSSFWSELGKIQTHIGQFLLALVFLPHRAVNDLDAIVRAIYRTRVSKSKRLEWMTAATAEKHESHGGSFWRSTAGVETLLAVILLAVIVRWNFNVALVAIPFLTMWAVYPWMAKLTQRKIEKKREELSTDDNEYLFKVARRIWFFFETFVTAKDNWLPPDNVQEDPEQVVAHRTSPTNMGLYALSTLSARDFGFISVRAASDRLRDHFTTLGKLERYRGHFLNWYDTTNLSPLYPQYVSTVDSGNMAGYLLVVKEGAQELLDAPLFSPSCLHALKVNLEFMEDEVKKLQLQRQETGALSATHLVEQIKSTQQILEEGAPGTLSQWAGLIRAIQFSVEDFKDSLDALEVEHGGRFYNKLRGWTNALTTLVVDLKKDAELFVLTQLISPESKAWLATIPGYHDLDQAQSLYATAEKYRNFFAHLNEISESDLPAELIKYRELGLKVLNNTVGLCNDLATISELCETYFTEMDFSFLIEKDREVFSIGFNVSENRHDNSYYDLLASECRLASFVAIAKRDVPAKHWFRLGRQLVPVEGKRALVSWSASMFEYLMPHLVMKSYENTLIGETLYAVVDRQISYGKKLNVPWGISEAGYNARDLNYNYQYGPFGIPGLGLKRGLGHDLVVSPYSSFLAALVEPVIATKNLRSMQTPEILTEYGFIEAIDYTPDRIAPEQPYALVKSYMAHHQGMSLIAIDNILNAEIMQNRFHAEPRVRAAQMLLQERVPEYMALTEPKAAEIEWESAGDSLMKSFVRVYDESPHHSPRVQILSNGEYSLMLSTSGSGFSKYGKLAVTRWREDATRDNWGQYIYIRDVEMNQAWSATYTPTIRKPDTYKAVFSEDQVEFMRKDLDIKTITRVIVAPEDNLELREVTLTNMSGEEKILELTSYLEPVLATLAADHAHPGFSNLFLQTDYLEQKRCLTVKRRPRSSEQSEIYGFHGIVVDSEFVGEIEYETDRSRFIGRGRDTSNPAALKAGSTLSNSIGSVLDPVLSLRVKLRVPPGGIRKVTFKTGYASKYDELLQLVDRYQDAHSFDRESKLAWTKSRIDLRHLGMDAESAYSFQRLAERLYFSDPSMRQPAHFLAEHTREQASLWPFGISGDVPIVAVMIGDKKDMGLVRKLLRGHEYLRLKGLAFDLVIMNESKSTYLQDLQDEVQWQIRYAGLHDWLNKPGGIFSLKMDTLQEADRALIQAMARVVISSDAGTFKEQVSRKVLPIKYAENFSPKSQPSSYEHKKITHKSLQYFNGLGGFSEDGREYVISLQEDQWPPAPWINVIANAHDFGFQVSESGSGFTWAVNSRENRLTPWSNDSVSDPNTEIIYIRDDDSGEVWTPTPLPIRNREQYTIRHGQGYSVFEHSAFGLSHELTMFVPPNDTVKITQLKIRNISGRNRRLSFWAYVEWVLGNQREKSAPYVLCEANDDKTLFATNAYNHEFAERVSFFRTSAEVQSFSCDRKEFLGRNKSYSHPEALKRRGLSGYTGIGQDPCAALQASYFIRDQEEIEIVFLLGQAPTKMAAQNLSEKYLTPDAVAAALQGVHEMWDHHLGAIQVSTPEPSLNLMVNRWSLYQSLVCRLWARSAFYQSGGAYGFRDQLQDCMAFVYSTPEIAREHILRAAARQFPEGDVQHWWHPPTGRGVRTHFSDDLLWLPYVVAHYIQVTGDRGILDQEVPFIEAPLLTPEQEDSYTQPKISDEKATLHNHCLRTFEHSMKVGVHGLPLIGSGDWNDGMNRIGEKGKGESVWMGWFLHKVMHDYLPYCDSETKQRYEKHMAQLRDAIETKAWDGEWYRRAYFDDGTPLGTSEGQECRIDSLSQTWSILSGVGQPERQRLAMSKVEENLIVKEKGLIKLLIPAFDKTKLDPGYIKGYVPGVRENGGQYTHAAIWVVMAFAKLQEREKVLELYNIINPIHHGRTRAGMQKYKIEPYVIAADVYAVEPHVGRGGWSWYTGSASWFYRAGLEAVLGFNIINGEIVIAPCVPESWSSFDITYRFKSTTYAIKVQISKKGPLPEKRIPLEDTGGRKEILLEFREDSSESAQKFTDSHP